MKIRNYIEQDKSDCLAIVRTNVPGYFSEADYKDFKEWFENQDCQNLYVIIDDDMTIGIGGFYFQNGQTKLIYGLIHSDYYGKGYGRCLTEYRIKKIKEIDSTIPIGLETTEKTYRFFEKFGFKTVDIVPKYYYGKFDKYEMILEPEKEMKTPTDTK